MPPFQLVTSRSLVGFLAAFITGIAALPLVGQEAGSTAPLPAAVELQVGLTELNGTTAGLIGVTGTIGLGGGFRVGVGAWSTTERVQDGQALVARRLDLGLGYGGVLVEYRPGPRPLAARLLVGGGAAFLRTLPLGTPFDTETFVVIEPAVRFHAVVAGPLSLGVQAGYRAVRQVDPRFLIERSALGGMTGLAVLTIGH